MEDTHGASYELEGLDEFCRVLILIIMEDTHGAHKQFKTIKS